MSPRCSWQQSGACPLPNTLPLAGEGRVGGELKNDDPDAHGRRPALAGVGFGTAAGSFGLASDTTVPGVSRYWPRTTTVFPALKPLSISASPLSVSRTETGCIATLWSAPTTKT